MDAEAAGREMGTCKFGYEDSGYLRYMVVIVQGAASRKVAASVDDGAMSGGG
ncbi:hypothetical protein BWQ96_10050 [Gracilariopsis chorda]|uniref:Uncharacterized protein n=1 Tax=Gracilariopsis chorda TaxID=448386 RepID=A0A2V3IDU1_9FLOR|nr:hypothetical protein BWQ96_10050 [Gracilariopsis chorda]|eukprot:PXF40246.1 hypothetical protein BWQ96_10050 [Gracilariopsis chorda]